MGAGRQQAACRAAAGQAGGLLGLREEQPLPQAPPPAPLCWQLRALRPPSPSPQVASFAGAKRKMSGDVAARASDAHLHALSNAVSLQPAGMPCPAQDGPCCKQPAGSLASSHSLPAGAQLCPPSCLPTALTCRRLLPPRPAAQVSESDTGATTLDDDSDEEVSKGSKASRKQKGKGERAGAGPRPSPPPFLVSLRAAPAAAFTPPPADHHLSAFFLLRNTSGAWGLLRLCAVQPPELRSASPAGGANKNKGGKRTTCLNCGCHQTPQWRCGPLGPRTLCNACGVRYKKGLPLNCWPIREGMVLPPGAAAGGGPPR